MHIRSQKTCSKLRDWGICIPKGKNNLEDVEIMKDAYQKTNYLGKEAYNINAWRATTCVTLGSSITRLPL